MATTTRTRVTNVDLMAAILGIGERVTALENAAVAAKPVTAATKANTRTRKAAKPAKPATKGAQTRETLSRKEWNRTLTAKAKLAGKYTNGESVYAYVLANWAEVQGQRDAGMTPDEVLAQY